jgi:hypothetical protein
MPTESPGPLLVLRVECLLHQNSLREAESHFTLMDGQEIVKHGAPVESLCSIWLGWAQLITSYWRHAVEVILPILGLGVNCGMKGQKPTKSHD